MLVVKIEITKNKKFLIRVVVREATNATNEIEVNLKNLNYENCFTQVVFVEFTSRQCGAVEMMAEVHTEV